MEYSVNEAMTDFTTASLWHRCNDLLSMTFFTLPVKTTQQQTDEGSDTEDIQVDVDTVYDPTTSNSTAYLHGMEAAIESILQRARQESPVFWTHVHRYVPSDSVWCEDINQQPTTTWPVVNNATIPDLLGHSHSSDTIKAHSLEDVVFVGEVSGYCICGWTDDDGSCRVPQNWKVQLPSTLQVEWDTLVSKQRYSTRNDLYTFLNVLEQTTEYDAAWFDTCTDLIPSVTWGLLDSKQHKSWFQYTSQDYDMSVHELATAGPSGLRWGILGRETNSLLNHVKKHQLLRRHPQHSPFNFNYQHTIAQPYCENNKADALHTDLTRYFRDVFFPMAHSVHESAVGAYCSTWVIEYAIHRAITHIYNDTGHAEVIAQANREATWKQRCFVQLQQIGICELRGSMAGFIGSVTRLRGKNAGGRQCLRCCVKRVHFLGPHAPFPRTKNAGEATLEEISFRLKTLTSQLLSYALA